MSAREVMRKAASDPGPVIGFRRLNETMPAYQVRAILSALSASGYRLLGPDELDPVTVERCWQGVANHKLIIDGTESAEDIGYDRAILHALGTIRSLTGGGNG